MFVTDQRSISRMHSHIVVITPLEPQKIKAFPRELYFMARHVHSVCAKIQQQPHFLHGLRVFGIQQRVMLLFYWSVSETILLRHFCLVWTFNCEVDVTNQ